MYYFVGLGNPGSEYTNTRHNIGRLVLEMLGDELGMNWRDDKTLVACVGTTTIAGQKVTFVLPETFMNDSGRTVGGFLASGAELKNIVVVYDELDLAFGTHKISFARSAGGHNGLISIIKHAKSENFPRIRLGVSKSILGIVRRPKAENMGSFLTSKEWTKSEMKELESITKTVKKMIETIVESGVERAMNEFN